MALSRLPDSADAPPLLTYVYLSLHLHILHPPNSPEALKYNSDINNHAGVSITNHNQQQRRLGLLQESNL